ncbi:dihydropteroate synthase [Rhodobacter sp. 24-YEA-8]|uniref:dihydropteroate synthase n=1 Tax=Rhodobacter sp. 24-YEA-8 TaxID=1884310 RepID=UPI00089A7F60|nr:dihydropteroate synthase [Rhodobacter sp. 24-YEA-8]SEB71983.1 Dihydropteroate synthase [Rhodobacter sp. 24-YEA-8]
MPERLPHPDQILSPLPRSALTGPASATRHALAGSRHLWWDSADRLSRRAPRAAPPAQLAPAETAAISRSRADLCGLTLDRPRIMGILNVTPDSFSDGGRHNGLNAAVDRAREMIRDAEILDIGGESTRPGATEVPVAEEIGRTAPVIRALREAGITTPISIDTRKARVAEAALEAGADIVNDVTALRFDPDMAALVAARGVPVVLMHSVATPETMQKHAVYDDVLWSVRDHLYERVAAALSAGIRPENLILDPGIGFGKTTAHDLRLLRELAGFHDFGLPLLLGASRKKFIGALTGAATPAERVTGSVAVALQGAAMGAHILRVHDTRETRQALSIWQAIQGNISEA